MTTQFYTDISNRLQSLSWFTYFKLFNNQFESMEEQQEQTFPNLSIFMEFLEPVEVLSLMGGVQMYDVTVRFHLYLISYELEDLDMFTYKQELHAKLQGFFPTSSSRMNRVNETPDQNHNGYMVWRLDYKCQIPDESGSFYANVVDAAPITLDLTTELIIDNEIIRTGKFPE
jgi:hypothetical protein